MNAVYALLKEVNAEMVRSRKHEVWKLPNGKVFVLSKSASDFRSEQNQLAEIRRLLGMTEFAFQDGERREKKPKPKPAKSTPNDNWWDLIAPKKHTKRTPFNGLNF